MKQYFQKALPFIIAALLFAFTTAAVVIFPPSAQRGDILIATSTAQFVRLATGTEGQVLKITSGLPAWGTDTGGGGGLATSSPFTSGFIPYATSTLTLTNSIISFLSGNIGVSSTTPGALLSVGNNAWINSSGVMFGTWQGAAIADAYVANDITLTNITQITNRSILDTSGTLTLARGGTGTTTALANQYLWWGDASGNLQQVASSTLAGTGGGTAADVQIFTASSTWTKPANAAIVKVILIGGGGGGGGGDSQVCSVCGGGSGGGGAAFREITYRAIDLPATTSVEVGMGGTGGASASGGSAGTAGGRSCFGSLCVYGGGEGRGAAGGSTPASGGGGGGWLSVGEIGQLNAQSSGGGPSFTTASSTWGGQGAKGSVATSTNANAEFGGGSGGAAKESSAGGIGGSSICGAGGGGGGGAVSTSAGGAGGSGNSYTAGGGGAGGASGSAGSAGANASSTVACMGASGGGGGGTSSNGGAGGIPGGGGGGGGSTNGGAAGAGGKGGRGEVRVFTYF